MNKNKEAKQESAYAEWIHKEWINQGGLIQPQVAAEILGVSITRIKQMRDEEKLKEFKDPRNRPMLSFSEVMEIQNNKSKNYIITYDVDIEAEEKIYTEHYEKEIRRNKPPQKDQIIESEYSKIKNIYYEQTKQEADNIEIYNLKITELIKE